MKTPSILLTGAALILLAGLCMTSSAQPVGSTNPSQPYEEVSNSSENNPADDPLEQQWLFNRIYNIKRSFGLEGSNRRGFHADTFTGGFGDFSPVKRRFFWGGPGVAPATGRFANRRFNAIFDNILENKRVTGMGGRGFHGDTFTGGFGEFSTMK